MKFRFSVGILDQWTFKYSAAAEKTTKKTTNMAIQPNGLAICDKNSMDPVLKHQEMCFCKLYLLMSIFDSKKVKEDCVWYLKDIYFASCLSNFHTIQPTTMRVIIIANVPMYFFYFCVFGSWKVGSCKLIVKFVLNAFLKILKLKNLKYLLKIWKWKNILKNFEISKIKKY